MDPLIIAIVVVVTIAVVAALLFVARRRSHEQPQGMSTAPSRTATVPSPSLRDRLSRTRGALAASLGSVFGSGDVGPEEWQELEDALVVADVGPRTASEVVAAVRARHPASGAEARTMLVDALVGSLDRADRDLVMDGSPAVVVVVGVNGTGKTTSIAKIAKRAVDGGASVVLAAADTYRAAADTQLRLWGDRVGVPVVSAKEGADPASVAFEALQQARTSAADVVIVDTAGRLHSQANLMDQLTKIVRILDRESGVGEVLLVLDGAVGQNGIAQARAFTEAVGVTGVVLTKLDGTAKGGVAIAVERELGIPVKLIGVGEGMDDLVPFVPEDFVRALVGE